MLMSKSAYAKHKNVSRQTVYDWIAKSQVVMTGNKIDVDATDAQQQNDAGTPENLWPHRTLELTWGEAYARVKELAWELTADNEEICRHIDAAAEELGYDVGYDGDNVCVYCEGEELHFTYNHFTDNAWLAVRYLRNSLRESAEQSAEDLDDWSEKGLEAVAITGFKSL